MCLLSKGKAKAEGDIIYQLPITHSSAVLWLLESTAAPCCPHPSYTGKWLSFKPKRGLWWLLVLRGVCRRGSSNKSPLWEFTAGILYLPEHPLGNKSANPSTMWSVELKKLFSFLLWSSDMTPICGHSHLARASSMSHWGLLVGWVPSLGNFLCPSDGSTHNSTQLMITEI